MKRIGLFLLTMCLAVPLFAQLEKGYIYLKNGSIIRGKYQYSDDLSRLQVLTDNNIVVYNAEEVDSIKSGSAYRRANPLWQSEQEPLFFRVETGFLFGSTANNQAAPLSFTGSVNYLIKPQVAIGAGVGVEFLAESHLPAFVNAEYRLRPYGATPYVFIHAGYLVPLDDSNPYYYVVRPVQYDIWPWPVPYYNEELKSKGGILFNPGLGYTAPVSRQLGVSVSFAYRFHRLNYSGNNDYQLEIDYNRLNVKIGIIFY